MKIIGQNAIAGRSFASFAALEAQGFPARSRAPSSVINGPLPLFGYATLALHVWSGGRQTIPRQSALDQPSRNSGDHRAWPRVLVRRLSKRWIACLRRRTIAAHGFGSAPSALKQTIHPPPAILLTMN